MKQRDLFGDRPSRVPGAAQQTPYAVEPFDDWDEARMVPQPDAVIPEEVRLPTDDEDWQPGIS